MTDPDFPEWLSTADIIPKNPVLTLLSKSRPLLAKGETDLLQLKESTPLTNGEMKVLDQTGTLRGLLNYALGQGISLEKIVQQLDWKSFEELVSTILEMVGWNTATNFRFIPPYQKTIRLELDVIAEDPQSRQVLVIDCKRYKTPSQAPIRKAVQKQKDRTYFLLNVISEIHGAIPLQFPHWDAFDLYPIILTWKNHGIRFHEGIPIVHISSFNDFLNSFDEYREMIFKIAQRF